MDLDGATITAWDKEDLDEETFQGLGNLINGACGIVLSPKKKPLLSARIRKRMKSLGITSPAEYYGQVLSDKTGMELVMLLDAVSTNVTSFFRDAPHFDALKAHVERTVSAAKGPVRVWSAACSTGEEAYSMAFTLRGFVTGLGADIRILASDISTRALGQAAAGCFSAERLKGIEPGIAEKWFEQGAGPGIYRVRRDVSGMILFKRLNLKDTPYPMKNPMDAIFCRNVMIYFDRELKAGMVREFRRLLRPGGLLFLGSTESLLENEEGFERTGPSIYRKL